MRKPKTALMSGAGLFLLLGQSRRHNSGESSGRGVFAGTCASRARDPARPRCPRLNCASRVLWLGRRFLRRGHPRIILSYPWFEIVDKLENHPECGHDVRWTTNLWTFDPPCKPRFLIPITPAKKKKTLPIAPNRTAHRLSAKVNCSCSSVRQDKPTLIQSGEEMRGASSLSPDHERDSVRPCGEGSAWQTCQILPIVWLRLRRVWETLGIRDSTSLRRARTS